MNAVPATWLKAVFVGAWCPKPIVDYTYAWHDAARQAFDDWHLQVNVLGMMQQGMLLTNNYDFPVGCLVPKMEAKWWGSWPLVQIPFSAWKDSIGRPGSSANRCIRPPLWNAAGIAARKALSQKSAPAPDPQQLPCLRRWLGCNFSPSPLGNSLRVPNHYFWPEEKLR